jgi:hypothetical protein
MVELAERDRMVLNLLEPEDRAQIEATVDEIIDEELPMREAIYIEAAAGAFDARAENLPDDEKIVAWWIAAALRGRVSPPSSTH